MWAKIGIDRYSNHKFLPIVALEGAMGFIQTHSTLTDTVGLHPHCLRPQLKMASGQHTVSIVNCTNV